MSGPALDPLITTPLRLQIAAVLASVREAEFSLLRAALDVSDSVLSKQLKQLEQAGYVANRKAASGGHLRTWLSLTKKGRSAFAAHVEALQRLASLAGDGGK